MAAENRSDVRSEALLRTAVRAGKVGLWDWEVGTTHVVFSSEWKRQLGHADEEVSDDLGEWDRRVHPEDSSRIRQLVADCVADRCARYESEYRMRHKDGSWRWFLVQGEVVRGLEGRVHFVGSSVDITDGKMKEDEVRQANRLLRLLSASNQALIRVVDEPDLLHELCRIAVEVGGYRSAWVALPDGPASGLVSAKVAVGRALSELPRDLLRLPPGQTHPCVRSHGGASIAVLPLVLRHDRRGVFCIEAPWRGEFLAADLEALNELAGDLSFGINVVETRAAHQRVEQDLREREERFRQVSENVDEIFWLTDISREGGVEHDQVLLVSPAYERISGRTCQSLLEDPLSWLDSIHIDDRSRVMTAWQGLTTVGRYEIEYRVVRPDGTIRWIRDRAFPVRNAAGRIVRAAGVAEDITERRRLEEHVREAQKMEAVGQLAGSIAHDFNNLLMVIQMQTSILLFDDQRAHQLAPSVRQGIEGIVDTADRAANLTRQLLTFSRRGVSQPSRLDLTEVVGTMIRLIERLLGEDIQIVTSYAPALPFVFVDPGMIEQVVMNLAVNGRDAMSGAGVLRISLEAVQVDAETAARHFGVTAGRFVCLSVADTGGGISPETLPRIFEPFFTTKAVGKGTGLGLSTVFGIAQQHGGFVDVRTEVGVGSEFRVYLPASAEAPTSDSRIRPEALPGGRETLLVVEDDAQVRLMVRTVLERYGYTIIEADSAATALAAWAGRANEIELLLTDLVLPGGMSGKALATALSLKKPGLEVIFMSGYTSDLVLNELGAQKNFLHKPFAAYELNALVRHCLRERKTAARAGAYADPVRVA